MSAPRILIVTQIFPPEFQGTALILKQLSHHLQALGWDVQVVTGFPSHPYGVVYEGYRKRPWMREEIEGIPVLRTWHLTHPSREMHYRASIFLSQAVSYAAGALFSRRADLLLVCGPTFAGPILNWAVARRHGARVVNLMYDIHPELAIETGHLKNPLMIKATRAAAYVEWKLMDRFIVNAHDLKQTLTDKGVPEERVEVAPLFLDRDEITPMDRDNQWRREHQIPLDKTVALYAGTIGVPSGAAILAEAADKLRHREDILFLVVGEGSEKPMVMQRVEQLKLPNVRFEPFQPREVLPQLQATSDISLITYRHGRHRTSWPSKMLGYMAAGRPIVATRVGGVGEMIRDGVDGYLVEPGNDANLADRITALLADSEKAAGLGRQARESAAGRFNEDLMVSAYENLYESVLLT